MAVIELTRGYTALVDDADYDLLNACRWHVTITDGMPYAVRSVVGEQTYSRIWLHMGRVILDCGAGEIADHINGDTLDNRRANLRIATPAQNAQNSRRKSSNTSGHKGVSWSAEKQQWRAEIMAFGKRTFLGRYDCLESAAHAYRTAAAQLHGEFARTD